MASDLGEVIFELTRLGAWLKCSAVHVGTGREVSAMGPATEPESLKRVALAKLKRALEAAASACMGRMSLLRGLEWIRPWRV